MARKNDTGFKPTPVAKPVYPGYEMPTQAENMARVMGQPNHTAHPGAPAPSPAVLTVDKSGVVAKG